MHIAFLRSRAAYYITGQEYGDVSSSSAETVGEVARDLVAGLASTAKEQVGRAAGEL
jgi:hypothetical protein